MKKYCPNCGKMECEFTGDGYVEKGNFDEAIGVFEEEGSVSEYTCKACGTVFFVWKNE
ncbi:MAG: hypothetical protein GX949_01950 [Peptococcaceae bacterium]|nr:hypothetical protein [Peptococcaceae bacterium]